MASGSIKDKKTALARGANTQFKKKGEKGGQSRKGNGRPKKVPELDVLMAELLSKVQGKGPTRMNAAQALINKLFNEAMRGNVRAAEIILNRAYGKEKQTIEHKNPDGNVFMFGYGKEEPV